MCCYVSLIELLNNNHLFAHGLNIYKCYSFNALEPQPPPSSTFKIIMGWVILFPREEFKDYGRDNHVSANRKPHWCSYLSAAVLSAFSTVPADKGYINRKKNI